MTAVTWRRWPRFSLRAMFVAVTVICCLLIWMGWQFEAVRKREKLLTRQVAWEKSNSHPASIPFIWSLLGASPINAINLPDDEFSDDDLRQYRAAFPEADVTLERKPFDPVTYMRKRHARRESTR